MMKYTKSDWNITKHNIYTFIILCKSLEPAPFLFIRSEKEEIGAMIY